MFGVFRKLKNALGRGPMTLTGEERIVRWRAMGARIGDDVFIGEDVVIDEGFAPLLTIANGAVISDQTLIMLHDSAFNNVLGLPIKVGGVTIGTDAYIGARTTILCGVTIGSRALVGATSLVLSDIPDETVAFGNPAVPRGGVRGYAERNRLRQVDDERFASWDVAPWRVRRHVMPPAEAARLRQGIIQEALRIRGSSTIVS